MFRLCFTALVAVILLSLSSIAARAETMADDRGCIDDEDGRYGYQKIHRIIIWEGNNLSYMEELPCGSGKWFERSRVSGYPPTTLNNPGVLTSSGTIEFSQNAPTAGIITEGTGPFNRGFMPIATSLKLIISAPVVQSLLTSLH